MPKKAEIYWVNGGRIYGPSLEWHTFERGDIPRGRRFRMHALGLWAKDGNEFCRRRLEQWKRQVNELPTVA